MAQETLQRVRFGKTCLKVSRLCQGTAFRNIGRHVDNPCGEAVIRHCLDVGINFFDTAIGYGDGSAEQALGKALAGQRDKAVICTKVGASHSLKRAGELGEPVGFARQFLADQLDRSLDRLGTDHVDLYLLHHPDNQTTAREVAESMDLLVQAGKTRYWGVSNFHAAQVEKFLALADGSGRSTIAGVEDYYNIAGDEQLERWDGKSRMVAYQRDMLPLLRRSGIGMLAYSPMDTGYLAPGRAVDPQSPIVDLVNAIDEVADELGVARATVCVAWVASHPQVTSVLAGAESAEHVDQNLAGTQLELAPDLLTKLNDASLAYHESWRRKGKPDGD